MCYMTRQLLPSPSEGALIRTGGWGEPSAPLPVWAAERTPERGGTRLATDPCPPGALPLPPSGEGRLRFPATPSKRGVLAARAIVDAGERQQPVCPRSGGGREQGLGGVLLEGLLGVLFNSFASLERKSEKLYYQLDLWCFPPDLYQPSCSGLLPFPKGDVVDYLGT